MSLISILTPAYNRGKTFLSDTIRSVQNQKENGFEHEHIIVDNASSDNTEEVVREFMKEDKRIKYIRNDENLWASGALNVAFEHSKGDLIVPFDDDDLMPMRSLMMRYKSMSNSDVMWSSGYAAFINLENKLLPFEYHRSNAEEFLDDNGELVDADKFFFSFFKKWMICGGTVTIRRKCVEEVGGWDPEFVTHQDGEMWIKLAYHRFKYKLVDNYLFYYRFHSDQQHKKDAKIDLWDKHLAILKKRYGVKDKDLE